jgi:hypothetical protein
MSPIAAELVLRYDATMTELPDGWDIERVRARAGGDAEVLSCDRRVVLDVGQGARSLPAALILSFGELCLVRSVGAPDWYMGLLDRDGSITCWGSYGTELGEAIDGL